MIGAVLVAVLLAAMQEGQGVALARLEQETVTVGDEVRVHVEIRGDCATDAELGPLPAIQGLELRVLDGPRFAVRSPTAPNAGDEYVAEYVVGVRPLVPGDHVLRGFTVICRSDERVRTNRLDLRAVPAVQAEPAFLTVAPARPEVYAREPFVVRIRLEIDARLSPRLTASTTRLVFPWWPTIVPVTPEAPLGERQRRFVIEHANRSLAFDVVAGVERDGVPYDVLAGAVRVLAPEPGRLSFAGSRFRCEVPDGGTGTFAGGSGRVHETAAPATSVTVLPVPGEGRPRDWVDAIGPLVIAADAHPREVTVGEWVTVSLAIEEVAPLATNVTTAEFPGLAEVPGFRVFDVADRLDGRRRLVEIDLSPRTAGVAAVPSFTVRWFDPERGAFGSASTEPLPITVHAHPDGRTLDGDEAGARWPTVLHLVLFTAVTGGVALVLIAGRRRRPLAVPAAAPEPGAAFDRLAATPPCDEPLEEGRRLAHYLAERLGGEPGAAFGADGVERLLAAGAPATLAREVGDWFESVERAAFGGAPAPRVRAVELARKIESAL